MNTIEQKIIKIFHNSNSHEQEFINKIYDFIKSNDIYKKPINISDYNLNKPINRFSSPVEILNKHLQFTNYTLDTSEQIKNNIIPIKHKS